MPSFVSQAGPVLPVLIPLAWIAAACVPCLVLLRRRYWHVARLFASAAVVLALVLLGMTFRQPSGELVTGSGILSFRADALSATVALMIALVGWSIQRFSGNYLGGDPGRLRFDAWFSLTLASVSILVLADHLALLALAWLATSLCLHRLLVFYPERPKALLAAHKKFLVSRLADTLLVIAFVLLAQGVGSAEISLINQRLDAGEVSATAALETAALLIVMAAALKSAQLPFHGWLIQVMEAPTPVSALLHAGVVNMGGYLLIRLSPLLEATQLAHWLLLALVHLIAHSFYKAHTFLSSGQAPLQSLTRRASAQARRGGGLTWGLALTAAAVTVVSAHYALGKPIAVETALTGVVIGSALTVVLAEMGGALGRAGWLRGLAAGLAITGAYYLAEHVFSGIAASAESAANPLAMGVAAVVLALLLAVRTDIMRRPEARLWRRARPLLFNGLYLDEAFNRVTFRLWPPKPRPLEEQPEPAPIYPDEGVSS